MKTSAVAIARALVELCSTLPSSERGALIDASLALLEMHGLGKDMRTFPRTVRRAISELEKSTTGVLITPSGTEEITIELLASIEKAVGKRVELSVRKDATLLGGALLQIGDERFDASLRGALEGMQRHLTLTTAHS
jgi:hypothetical protein